jgi:DNA-binding response OmpR family regulator
MKKKLLLVDDDLSVRQMLTRLLISEGYTVFPAENGEKAFILAKANEIDLVLLDLQLPQHSGWDIFEKLSSEYPLLPVIIITARPNQLFLALGAGVSALFEKPLDFPKLLETIKTLLAETAETRLSRLAGQATEFHYLPQPLPKREPQKNLASGIRSGFHHEL